MPFHPVGISARGHFAHSRRGGKAPWRCQGKALGGWFCVVLPGNAVYCKLACYSGLKFDPGLKMSLRLRHSKAGDCWTIFQGRVYDVQSLAIAFEVLRWMFINNFVHCLNSKYFRNVLFLLGWCCDFCSFITANHPNWCPWHCNWAEMTLYIDFHPGGKRQIMQGVTWWSGLGIGRSWEA